VELAAGGTTVEFPVAQLAADHGWASSIDGSAVRPVFH
jgi:hypothetical protein